jgi:hypothetical protein
VSDCQTVIENFSPEAATIDAKMQADSKVSIQNVSGADPFGNGWRVQTVLGPAEPPTVDAIAPGGSPFGYFSLASLGVPPISGMGDESAVNVGTSTYLFGDEPYSTIGIVSNGYAVVGGATSSDIDYIPQSVPDGAAPNNVLAPFWTDLNPEAGGSLYAAELISGPDRWIVLEWEDVPVFSTPSETQTFQIWIQVLPAGTEFTSYEYETIMGTGDPAGLNVGAENRDGSSGVNLGSVPANGDAYHIETSPPQAGGSVIVDYEAMGEEAGSSKLVVSVTSDVQVGSTTVITTLTVT